MNRPALDAVWKALADASRRRILDELRDGPRTTGDLCRTLKRLSRFAVMKHLAILESAGLIIVVRRGRERWNYLNAVPIQQIYERWVKPYEAHWASKLLHLKSHIEQKGDKFMATKNQGIKSSFSVAEIELSVALEAEAKRVWKALVGETTKWWPKYFYAGENPKGFHIEPKLGGRMYEEWEGGGGLVWANVVGLAPGRSIDFLGHLSSQWGGPAMTQFRFRLEAQGKGTVVHVSDTSFGRLSKDKAASTRKGWMALIDVELRAHMESKKNKRR